MPGRRLLLRSTNSIDLLAENSPKYSLRSIGDLREYKALFLDFPLIYLLYGPQPLDIESRKQERQHKRGLEAGPIEKQRLQVYLLAAKREHRRPWNRDNAPVFQKLQKQVAREREKHNRSRKLANYNTQEKPRDRANAQVRVVKFSVESRRLHFGLQCLRRVLSLWQRKSNCIIPDERRGSQCKAGAKENGRHFKAASEQAGSEKGSKHNLDDF